MPPLNMKILFSFAILLTLAWTGCGPAPSATNATKGGVALIDLEAAARRLGRDVVITQELKDAGGVLGEELATAQNELRGEFERLKQSVGAKPTETDNQKLAEMGRNLNLQFQQKQQQAQQELAAKRLALVNRFREELKPLAMKIASGKGLGVVLVKSDAVVLAIEPALDITDDVVAEMTRLGQSTAGASPSPDAK